MTRAVVIGSGFGGLGAAVRLRAMGYDVVVLEALDQPGGRARAFQREVPEGRYLFDAGPTVITAPYLLDELFTLVGRDPHDYFQLAPVDPFYRVEFDASQGGGRFDYVGDEARLLDQIASFNPKDVEGYKKMAAHMERIFDIGYTQLADKPFDRLSDMLRIVPEMMKLESFRTVYQLAAKYIEDERLRQVFTFQPLLVGGNPFTTTSIYCLIHWLERKWGVHFAMGGTTSLVRALTQLLDELGVQVRMNAPVARIEVKDGRTTGVTLESGEHIGADLVVSNGDPSMVYSKLIDRSHLGTVTKTRTRSMSGSMSLFVAYFGTRKTFTDIKHHTIVLGPRYRELLDDIFKKKVLADDFSLYLHRPTITDPTLAPAGHDAFYVLSPVPNLQGGQDWAQERERYLDKILTSLEQRLMPGLKASLTTSFTIDPLTFQNDYRTLHGAAFGPQPVLTQSAWFRYHNRSPDVDGLYFVGAGTHPGAGVPGVLCSAKVLERVVPRPADPLALPEKPARRLAGARAA